MYNKNNPYKFLTLLLCTTILTSCTSGVTQVEDETDTKVNVDVTTTTLASDIITYEEDDFYSDWANENPIYIALSGTNAEVEGTGVASNDGEIKITEAGVYVLSGKLDGQIVVDVQDEDTVKLVLNGVDIKSKDSAPIYIKNAKKTIISLNEGTKNQLTDGDTYIFSDTEAEEPSSAVFSKDSLTINGSGSLIINANFKDGMVSKDDLRITGGSITINSKDDGIIGKDIVIVKEGSISIQAGGDGIKSTNDSDTQNGFVAIEGGIFNIVSGSDGLQASNSIIVYDGDFTLNSGGGSVNGNNENKENAPMSRNQVQAPIVVEQKENTTDTNEESNSAKAIKATSDIKIQGGMFAIDSADDAIHSNGNLSITGGDIDITSGDDGLHADATITIDGGDIKISKSYEGIESAIITINDGNIYVVSNDDGINVAGGNDNSSINGRSGQNAFTSPSSNQLQINGGYIYTDAMGDGLDANGSIEMTNGTVIVNGPTNSGNGALDYDGTFNISGGLLIASGSSGMVQGPSEGTGQYSVIMNFSSVQEAGTLLSLVDQDGNEVVTFAPNKQFQSVVISSPDIKKDMTYTLYTGGTSTGTAINGLYLDGVYSKETEVVSITITNDITWLSESGETTGNQGFQGRPKGTDRNRRFDNGDEPMMPPPNPPEGADGTTMPPPIQDNQSTEMTQQ